MAAAEPGACHMGLIFEPHWGLPTCLPPASACHPPAQEVGFHKTHGTRSSRVLEALRLMNKLFISSLSLLHGKYKRIG